MSLEPHAAEEIIVETLAAHDEKAKLKKHFGRFDMLFFLICTLVGVDTLGQVASKGPEGFTWMVVLAVLFFVPYALLTAELGSAFTDEGGCYVWTKLAWGRFVAAVNSVLYWLSNPVWMGGLLCITAVTTFNTFFTDLGGTWQYVFSLVFIWFAVWATVLSFGVGKWIPTLGAWRASCYSPSSRSRVSARFAPLRHADRRQLPVGRGLDDRHGARVPALGRQRREVLQRRLSAVSRRSPTW